MILIGQRPPKPILYSTDPRAAPEHSERIDLCVRHRKRPIGTVTSSSTVAMPQINEFHT
jgi:hypothetical protein